MALNTNWQYQNNGNGVFRVWKRNNLGVITYDESADQTTVETHVSNHESDRGRRAWNS